MSIQVFKCQPWWIGACLWLFHCSVSHAELDVAELPADRAVTYSRDIAPVLKKNCLACHNDQDAECGVNLETVEKMRASDVDELLVPGKPDSSRLFLLAAHRDDPVMPPEDNDVSASTLNPTELALLRRWIQTGAKVDVNAAPTQAISFQPLPPQLKTNYSSAMTPDARLTAVAFGNRVRIFAGKDASTVADLEAVVDGQSMPPHQDFVQDLVIDAEGRRVISSGYRNIKIWEMASPQRLTIPTIEPDSMVGLTMNRPGTHVARLSPQGELSVTEVGKARWEWMKGFDLPSSWTNDPPTAPKMAVDDLGGAVAVGSGSQIWVVRIDGKQVEVLRIDGDLTQITWASDGRLVVGGSQGQVWIASRDADRWTQRKHAVLGESLAHLEIGVANPNLLVAIDRLGDVARLQLDDGTVESMGKLPAPVPSVAVFPDADGLWAVNASGDLGVYRFAEKKWIELAKSDPIAVERHLQDSWETSVGERLVAANKKDLSLAEESVKAEQGSLEAISKDIDAKTKTREEKRKAFDAAALASQRATEKETEAKRTQEQANLQRTELTGSIKKLNDTVRELEKQLAELKTQKVDQEKQLAMIPDAKTLADTVTSTTAAASKARKDTKSKQVDFDTANKSLEAAEEKKKRGEQRLSELNADVANRKQIFEASESRQSELKKNEAASKARAEQSNASDLGLIALAGGKLLLTYSEASSTWSLWSDAGQWLAEVPELRAQQSIVASGDSRLLSKGPEGSLAVVHFDPTLWQLIRSIGSATGESPLADRVLCMDVDPSGRYLATGGGLPSRTGELLIWDLANGQLLHRIDQPHADTVTSLRFSTDGKMLATGGADRMLKLWNTADWTLIKTLEGHTHHVTAIDWNVNRRQLASGSADATVKVWDVETGKASRTVTGLKSEVTKLTYVGCEDRIAIACGDGYFRVYRTDNGKRETNVKLPGGYLYALGGDRKGTRFVVGGSTGQAVIVDQSGKQVAELKASE